MDEWIRTRSVRAGRMLRGSKGFLGDWLGAWKGMGLRGRCGWAGRGGTGMVGALYILVLGYPSFLLALFLNATGYPREAKRENGVSGIWKGAGSMAHWG